MKNNLILIFFVIKFVLTSLINVNASDQFIFDITEIEISEKGNLFKGMKEDKLKQILV